jgi:type 1 glutamine amidotransferase
MNERSPTNNPYSNIMKIPSMRLSIGTVLAAVLLLPVTAMAAPKKVLVVSTTTGFRHSSIPTMNKVIGQLGERSKAFTVDYLEQPPGQPSGINPPKPLAADASDADKTKFQEAQAKYDAELPAFQQAQAKWSALLKESLMKLSAESLKNYDAVIFANTTGDLPIPDREGFLAWLKSGKAFIGLHAATDTFHGWPEYIEFIGGEFGGHGPQLTVSCINEDPKHPANKHIGKTFDIALEEMYQIKNHDRSKEHELLSLDKKPVAADPQPGFYPVSWCHLYGKGKVFYSSLGHREDIIDADPDIKDRKNSVEVSKTYQAHVLGGILWALGLAPGDATPQSK